MNHPESNIVAQTLKHLTDAVQPPEIIDEGYFRADISAHEVVMTSVGNRRKAIITPAFPGLQYQWNLSHRLSMAGLYQRPMVEAVLGYSRKNRVAAVTLRLAMLPQERNTLETAWLFDLDEVGDTPDTAWKIVEGIVEHCHEGQPIANRSGIVVLTDKRQEAHNWAISNTCEPGMVASEMYGVITSKINFHRF